MKLHLNIPLIILCLFIVGCTQQEEDTAMEREKTDNQIEQVKNSSPTHTEDLNNSEIASHLANIASNVPNVKDAAAVVAGPYAVVGIDVDKDLDRSRVGTIKYTVSEALYHDPYGKTAVVVADADMLERIRLMGQKIQQGEPVQGIIDELSAIVGRYMPNFPINDRPPEEPDQNKQIMPEDEEKELDKIEQEQSNHNRNN